MISYSEQCECPVESQNNAIENPRQLRFRFYSIDMWENQSAKDKKDAIHLHSNNEKSTTLYSLKILDVCTMYIVYYVLSTTEMHTTRRYSIEIDRPMPVRVCVLLSIHKNHSIA